MGLRARVGLPLSKLNHSNSSTPRDRPGRGKALRYGWTNPIQSFTKKKSPMVIQSSPPG
ncbi:hypothetical protein SynWH8101_1910 [Synechococcus sp. WH 8101]|nr:hypothetical protein SynWH8101_1910 [Synechococcus sp. WH 8101]